MARKTEMANKHWGRRLAVGLAWATVSALLLAIAGVAGLLWYYGQDLPRLITVEDYHPPRASVVLARDGSVLARFGVERRTVVPMAKIPPIMRQAIIAAEDAEFYTHKGLDYPGMLRALLAAIRAGGHITQGGSTITQQLVKSLILTPERTMSRKAKEIILARQVEANLSKDEILFLYLNQIYMGHGNYGVEEASNFYFGHGVEALTLGEAAMLSGLVQSPERLSPIRHPEAARTRRRYVLHEMAKRNFITEAMATEVDASPLGAVVHDRVSEELAPHFVEAVRIQVQRELGQETLLEGGLKIETTLDPKLQAAANEAVVTGLDLVDRRQKLLKVPHRNEVGARKLLVDEVERRDGKAPSPGHVVRGVVRGLEASRKAYLVELGGGVTGRLSLESLGRYLMPGKGRKEPIVAEEVFAGGDVLRVRITGEALPDDPLLPLQPALGPEAALVALDPDNREVLALVGGDPRTASRFDRVLQARRQPGSSFKPIVYTAALGLRRRDLTLATLIDDSPSVYVGVGGKQWAPKNFDGKFRGPIRMREAITHSVNMVAIKLLEEVGVERVISLAHDMGIVSELDPYLPLALGASAVKPIELANAYATLASGGKVAEPILIRRIAGPDGATLFEQTAELVQTVPPDLACLATDMLTSVVQEGTASRAKVLARPVAGKTGTTNDQTDAWFSGYIPHLVATVWVGNDDNFPLSRGEQGGQTALPIWIELMRSAVQSRPVEPFPACPGVVERTVDKKSGLLALPGELPEQVLVEKFLEGTEPLDVTPQPGELSPDNFLIEQTGQGPEAAPAPGDGPPPTGDEEEDRQDADDDGPSTRPRTDDPVRSGAGGEPHPLRGAVVERPRPGADLAGTSVDPLAPPPGGGSDEDERPPADRYRNDDEDRPE